MPIYQGISTKNKDEIIINSLHMQKVYVGDRLVWQKPGGGIFYPEYGALYNWYAATDVRKITSSDDWIIPNRTQTLLLTTNVGGFFTGAFNIKESGTTHWNTNNGINSFGFNSRGNGKRGSLGTFQQLKEKGRFKHYNDTYTSDYTLDIRDTIYEFTDYGSAPIEGEGVRLLYVGAGTPETYTGNDGKIYRTVNISGQIWIADNLCETKFRNGDIIPWHGATPASYFTNAEWAALTTAGVCAYDNTLSNVATGFTFPI